MKILKHWRCWLLGEHTPGQMEMRRVEVEEKKNKPPERLVEFTFPCLECGGIAHRTYLRDDEAVKAS